LLRQIHFALLAFGASLAAAVQPVEVQGQYFINPISGDRLQIVGVAYQPGGSAGYNPALGKDPLSNKDNCLRDAALMQVLGINAIRVYNLDPDLNHDECASIFNSAGMYMLLDVNSPLAGESLNSAAPWESYYAAYVNRTFAVVEAFKNYPNTLAFFSGNEVISDVATGGTVPPYVRAVTRDLKNYIAKHVSRPIPVGYSAADVRTVLFDSWNYFQCAENGAANDSSRADLFALNSYSWCGDSSFTTSGYDTLVAGFTGSSVPIFYSEYGCNKPSPRVFTEVGTIYGSNMTDVFSGGVVYEYAQEVSNFGLVSINDDGSADILDDFYTLKSQYAKLDFTQIQGAKPANTTTPTPPACNAKLITTTGFNDNFTIPVPPPGVQKLIDEGIGFTGSGKIVSIDSWAVTQTVKNPDGSVVSNLAVKPLANDATNRM
jgi:1,3-beta-glucanosyltransferase GAS3